MRIMKTALVALIILGCGFIISSPVALAAGDDDYTLKSASITFDLPNGDNKDKDTSVSVEVVAVKGGTRTTIADKLNFAGNEEWDDPSTHTVALDVKNKIKKIDINQLSTSITENPNGNDRWIFHYTLTLTFEKGTETTTVTQSVKNIILDQNNRTRKTDTWVRFPEDKIGWKLKDAKMVFTTPAKNDNKDKDKCIDVDLTFRLNEMINIVAASTHDIACNEEYKDPSVHTVAIALKSPITLEQYTRSVTKIEIRPNGNDRWIFDYRFELTFEGDGQSFLVVEERSGLILDQQNRTFRRE